MTNIMGSDYEEMDFTNPSHKRKSRSASGSCWDSVIEKDAKMAKKAPDGCVVEIDCEAIKLTKMNPVKIKKWLVELVGTCDIKPLASGKLVVSCSTESGGKLMKCRKYDGHKITVQRHIPANIHQSLKGIAHGVDFDFSEDDLKDDLSCESGIKITDVKRLGNTKSIVITFSGTQLPSHVFFGYLRFSVKLFIPNPIRCYQCQRYGHIAKNCHSVIRCGKCGQNHDIKECKDEQQEKCCNCQGNHKASSRDCEFYKEAQVIVKVKTEQRLTYSEAVKQVRAKPISVEHTNKDLNSSKVQSSVSAKSQRSQSSVPETNSHFDWNHFAAFMIKACALFTDKAYQGKNPLDQLLVVSELMTECFQITIDKTRAFDIFKEMPSITVPNTKKQ